MPQGGSSALQALSPQARFAFLNQKMQGSARWTRIWKWTWVGVWGAGTAAQLALIPAVDDPGSDADNAVGAAATGLSLIAQLLIPLAVLDEQPQLAALEGRVAGGDCAALADAEARFKLAAEDQAAAISWPSHAINVGLNAAYALVLGLGFKRWESGAIGAAVGLALGELMIFSQPRQLEDDLEAYLRGSLGATAVQVHVLPLVGGDVWGLQAGMTF